jgi:hypothetical protein
LSRRCGATRAGRRVVHAGHDRRTHELHRRTQPVRAQPNALCRLAREAVELVRSGRHAAAGDGSRAKRAAELISSTPRLRHRGSEGAAELLRALAAAPTSDGGEWRADRGRRGCGSEGVWRERVDLGSGLRTARQLVHRERGAGSMQRERLTTVHADDDAARATSARGCARSPDTMSVHHA